MTEPTERVPVTRLFPDYAAAPTRTERATARRNNAARQPSLFGPPPAPIADVPRAEGCPVCAGPHRAEDCTAGTALRLI